MFVCCVPLAAIATVMAFLVAFRIENIHEIKPETSAWHPLVIVLSAGFYFSEFYSSHTPHRGWDFTPLKIAMLADFSYYFCLIFGFAIWADRRWRRKRAELIAA